MRDGHLEASGHNWVEGQGSGPRIGKKEGEEDDQYDAMGNKIDATKNKKLTSAEARKVRFVFSLYLNHGAYCPSRLARPRRNVWRARKRAGLSAMTKSEMRFDLHVHRNIDFHNVHTFGFFILQRTCKSLAIANSNQSRLL